MLFAFSLSAGRLLRYQLLGRDQQLKRDGSRMDRMLLLGMVLRDHLRSIWRHKQFDLLLHAAKAAGVRAVFIGDGPQKDEIRAACPEAEILGWIESSQVAGLLREARALVFPSLWYECQPLVPLEALAAGIPVISGDWTAGRESVVNGRNGIIIKDLDPQGSFGAALAALKDPEAARRYGNAAYQMFWADPLTMSRPITICPATTTRSWTQAAIWPGTTGPQSHWTANLPMASRWAPFSP